MGVNHGDLFESLFIAYCNTRDRKVQTSIQTCKGKVYFIPFESGKVEIFVSDRQETSK